MKIQKFEDIIAWQHAKEVCAEIYQITRNNKDWGFNDQLQRAAVSIMNNIAEGYERGTAKEFRQFLFIAKGSCGEVRSMLALGVELHYIPKDQFDKLNDKVTMISKMLYRLIQTLKIEK